MAQAARQRIWPRPRAPSSMSHSNSRRTASSGCPATGGSGAAAGTWLVDGRDGQVIWYMDLASLATASGKGSFNEEVPLGRGAYSWYRPSGWKATALWQGRVRNGSWQPLTMFVGTERRPESRRAG